MSDIESPNKTIIQEFKKLVNFIQTEIDKFSQFPKIGKDTKAAAANTFRLKQIKNALLTITKYPKKITDDTLDEVLRKGKFWDTHAKTLFNNRQQLMLNKLCPKFVL